MISANVASAAQLEGKGGVCLYRVHDKPTEQNSKACAISSTRSASASCRGSNCIRASLRKFWKTTRADLIRK